MRHEVTGLSGRHG